MDRTFRDIPLSNTWKTIKEIKEGWSDDKKYYIEDHKGASFLLRLSDELSLEREKAHYNALRKLNDKEIPISKLLESGLCNNGKNTYRIFSWIEGVEILKILDKLSGEQQYKYGYDSGKILREIHLIDNPVIQQEWSEFYSQKIDAKILKYQNCGVTFKNSENILTFIQANRILIENRPQCFHHGDYHLGNMLITPQKELAIIDFNRLDSGDPWEEFNRITWSAINSYPFAKGQINGYFSNEVPEAFFKLMALYVGVNQIGSIPWAIQYGGKELQVILSQVEKVLEWYDNFDQFIPNWYKLD